MLAISYPCVIWHFQIFLKFFKSTISHQHRNMHVCFLQLEPIKTKLRILGQPLHEIHGHVNHLAVITKQPRKKAGLSLAATHFWKPPPCGWAVLTPSMVLAWMGAGCDDRAGRWIQCQRPEESWKMHQTTQQWLLAWKKLPWILDPSHSWTDEGTSSLLLSLNMHDLLSIASWKFGFLHSYFSTGFPFLSTPVILPELLLPPQNSWSPTGPRTYPNNREGIIAVI